MQASSVATPMDESKRALEAASTTNDPRERCKLVREAVLLDGGSIAAHQAYASTRCAPAKELLLEARLAFVGAPSVESASVLATVAMRAGSASDATTAAAALVERGKDDVEAMKLAARAFARFGDHEKAARLYERIAAERAAKGGSLDALDARLDGAMESARAKGKGAPVAPRADLLAAIDAATSLASGYGDAWIGPKVIEAISVLRSSGDLAGANDATKRAREKKLFDGADGKLALDLERAIADARAGNVKAILSMVTEEKKASRVKIAGSRALLSVWAKATGKCGAARAYARAHDATASDAYPRFDDDVTWARDCTGGEIVATLTKPMPSDAVDDAIAVAKVDPLRARGVLQSIVDSHDDDVAARLALASLLPPSESLSVLDAGLKKSPSEPALHFGRLERLVGAPRANEGAEIAKVILPSTIEVFDDPRAAVPVLSELVMRAPDDKESTSANATIAAAFLRACAGAPKNDACMNDKGATVARAAHLLRTSDAASLAANGPSLCDADLAQPKVRLEVIIALLDTKQIAKAEAIASPKRGKWEVPETGLAEALIASEKQKCEVAKSKLAQWPVLSTSKEYAPEIARVKNTCKIPP